MKVRWLLLIMVMALVCASPPAAASVAVVSNNNVVTIESANNSAVISAAAMVNGNVAVNDNNGVVASAGFPASTTENQAPATQENGVSVTNGLANDWTNNLTANLAALANNGLPGNNAAQTTQAVTNQSNGANHNLVTAALTWTNATVAYNLTNFAATALGGPTVRKTPTHTQTTNRTA